MEINGIIFDFDGTLADSMWVWEQVDLKFLGKRNLPYSREYVETIAVLGFEQGADFVIEEFGLDEDPDDIIEEWKEDAAAEYAQEVLLKPDAADFLHYLKDSGYPLAIATSLQRPLLEPCLKNNGIYDLFDTIKVCDELGCHGKSNPTVYLEAARALGAEPERTLVFEDVATCARSAKQGGFQVVGVRDDNKQQNRDELMAASDYFLESYAEGRPLIEKIRQA